MSVLPVAQRPESKLPNFRRTSALTFCEKNFELNQKFRRTILGGGGHGSQNREKHPLGQK